MFEHEFILRDYSKLPIIRSILERMGVNLDSLRIVPFSEVVTHIEFKHAQGLDMSEILGTGHVSVYWIFDDNGKIIDTGKPQELELVFV